MSFVTAAYAAGANCSVRKFTQQLQSVVKDIVTPFCTDVYAYLVARSAGPDPYAAAAARSCPGVNPTVGNAPATNGFDEARSHVYAAATAASAAATHGRIAC